MKKTITIGCALILTIAACGTPSVDGPDTQSVATSGTEPVASEPSQASNPTGDTVDPSKGATTTTTATTSTVRAQAPATTRPPSGASGGAESSTTTAEGSDDGTAEGGGDDAVTGQVPTHLMDQVFAHAVDHTGTAASSMTVLRAESVTWPDGSLGCPEPGMQYTQALVPGYWVELEVDGEVLDYRLSDKGGLKLCEGGGSVPSARDDT